MNVAYSHIFTFKRIIFIILLYLCLYACATPGTPSGGPKDTTAPTIDSTKTTPNLQTNFEKQRIEFTFEEWVQLKDINNQIVISPPLDLKDYDVTIRGKTVRFEFAEELELRENATYTINFGEAVQDITEGNPVEDLRFVFSTGDVIDSLELSGNVVDATTRKPAEGALVMLYDNLSDTVVRTERPFYFAKVDEQGNFTIKNLKAGTFKAFALLNDSNQRYLFDSELEQIGFLEENITITDTLKPRIKLEIFQEQLPLILMDDELTQYGLATLTFNREPYDVTVGYEGAGDKARLEKDGERIKIWFDNEDTWAIFLEQGDDFRDTIKVEGEPKSEFLETAKLKRLDGDGDRAKSINPILAVEIEMNHPLMEINSELIKLYEDSLKTLVTPKLNIDTSNSRSIKIAYPWKEGINYNLEILPEALTDIYGLQNDTIAQAYAVKTKEDFGLIDLTINELDESGNYILQLLTQNDNLVKEYFIKEKTTFKEQIKMLFPSVYVVKLIEDRNANQRWDSGNYDLKQQAESIYTQELEALRPNWELEAVVVPKW